MFKKCNSFCSQTSFAMKLAIVLVALCLHSVSTEGSPFGTMEPAKVRNIMKRTYCEEMSGTRVYIQEQLESDCIEKVQFFGENVSTSNSNSLIKKPQQTLLTRAFKFTFVMSYRESKFLHLIKRPNFTQPNLN